MSQLGTLSVNGEYINAKVGTFLRKVINSVRVGVPHVQVTQSCILWLAVLRVHKVHCVDLMHVLRGQTMAKSGHRLVVQTSQMEH